MTGPDTTPVPPLLSVENLSVAYKVAGREFLAVDDISYAVAPGETLGVVGESGSGKSTQLMALLALTERTSARVVSGRAMFKGRDLFSLSSEEMRAVRGREIGMIFQSPLSSLNPVLTIGRQIVEPIVAHGLMTRRAARERACELLELVRIPEPRQRLRQFPHQLSGGMRQRVMIAIALSCEPSLLLADEPTTALDVTVQAQIIDLVNSLRKSLGMAVIWVTHDLAILARIADAVQVMYAGQIMEQGPVGPVFSRPRNAYTLGLLQSLPGTRFHGEGRLKAIPGTAPGPFEKGPGDPFAPRNPYATQRCLAERPPLRPVPGSAASHRVAAWYDLPDSVLAPMERNHG
jgi:peptide/nickel transport system ATP-binding protein/oligopeptide transport system ATP-binding protein